MHVCLFSLYRGTEPWPVPIFFTLRKYAFGWMERSEQLNRLRANRYKTTPSSNQAPLLPTPQTEKAAHQNAAASLAWLQYGEPAV